MATRKTNTIGTPAAPIPAGWFVTGRGRTANYYAAVDADETSLKSDAVVALTAKTGAVTFGRLNGPATDLDEKAAAKIPAGVAVWTFTKAHDLMSAELRAENAAKKAEARAEFLRSEAGIAQAERIAASAAKKAANAAAGILDTSTVTVTVDPSIVTTATTIAATAATDSAPSLRDQAEALKAAGFSATEILVALSTVNPPAAEPTPAKTPAKTPRKSGPVNLATLNAAAGKRK